MPQHDDTTWQETRHDPAFEAEPESDGDTALATRPVTRRTAAAAAGFDASDPSTWGKVQRNAPCPCGSGRNYKPCHGRLGRLRFADPAPAAPVSPAACSLGCVRLSSAERRVGKECVRTV